MISSKLLGNADVPGGLIALGAAKVQSSSYQLGAWDHTVYASVFS